MYDEKKVRHALATITGEKLRVEVGAFDKKDWDRAMISEKERDFYKRWQQKALVRTNNRSSRCVFGNPWQEKADADGTARLLQQKIKSFLGTEEGQRNLTESLKLRQERLIFKSRRDRIVGERKDEDRNERVFLKMFSDVVWGVDQIQKDAIGRKGITPDAILGV